MITRPTAPGNPANLPVSLRRTSLRYIAEGHTSERETEERETEEIPRVTQRSTYHAGSVPGPVLRSTTHEEGIGRTQYELTCDLAPPSFPVEDLLHTGIRAFYRRYGFNPGYLYIHWQQVAELIRVTGSSYFEDIPVHTRRGIGFWCVVATRYKLAEETS